MEPRNTIFLNFGRRLIYVRRRYYTYYPYWIQRWRVNLPIGEKPPALPPPPEEFAIPICVTSVEGSRRSPEEVERLVAAINRSLKPARIELQISETFECPSLSARPGECPFGEELDHSMEWLQLVMVPELPEDRPVMYGCGRCCAISDRCDDRSAAQCIASLLGLATLSGMAAPERLMGPGIGHGLNDNEIFLLRRSAAMMLGRLEPLRELQVSVRGYRAEGCPSRRSENEFRQILEKVNRVYEAAGIVFVPSAWCNLLNSEVSAESWGRVLSRPLPDSGAVLGPLVAYGPMHLHVMFVGSAVGARPIDFDPRHRLVLFHDVLQVERTRNLAHAFGRLLGLTQKHLPDQLMCPQGEGFRLSPREIATARGQAYAVSQAKAPPPVLARPVTPVAGPVTPPGAARVVAPAPPAVVVKPVGAAPVVAQAAAGPAPVAAGTSPPSEVGGPDSREIVLPLRIHLTPGVTSPQALLDSVNRFWRPVRIRWNLSGCGCPQLPPSALSDMFPNAAKIVTERKPNWQGLTGPQLHDPGAVNLFYVEQIPYVGSNSTSEFQVRRGERTLVVAERCQKRDPARILARGLASLLGLNCFKAETPADQLLSHTGSGTGWSEADIRSARAAANRLHDAFSPVCSQTFAPLSLRVRVYALRNASHGTALSAGEARARLETAAPIWAKAGIALLFGVALEHSLPDEAIWKAFPPRRDYSSLTALPGYDKGATHVFWVRKIFDDKGTYASATERKSRCLLLKDSANPGEIASAFGLLLNLDTNEFHRADRLMSPSKGDLLTVAEVARARREVEKYSP